ncbi:hypothetical protein BO71DRAFT_254701 [Aspergillus ellipticus CBS 707.79]|uniref:Uncharacterized protein n=1 Tax=Aspergillus ellipticus CBS 707.79 TaxID=1448320 RepID=A0A319D8G5_9EURO|nr:hypothetical protein BO71DRAFT_254701 [Aspergillus ellipticus CBS 707.79]
MIDFFSFLHASIGFCDEFLLAISGPSQTACLAPLESVDLGLDDVLSLLYKSFLLYLPPSLSFLLSAFFSVLTQSQSSSIAVLATLTAFSKLSHICIFPSFPPQFVIY